MKRRNWGRAGFEGYIRDVAKLSAGQARVDLTKIIARNLSEPGLGVDLPLPITHYPLPALTRKSPIPY
jgi:hypothetical protein